MATDFYQTDIAFIGDFIPTDSGGLELVDGLANLRQALEHRLLTTPGSLIHRPNYGVGIKSFQNALNSLANKSEIFSRVREQFLLDPRVEEVSGISFKIDDLRPELTQILIRIKPRGYDEQQVAFIPFGDVA